MNTISVLVIFIIGFILATVIFAVGQRMNNIKENQIQTTTQMKSSLDLAYNNFCKLSDSLMHNYTHKRIFNDVAKANNHSDDYNHVIAYFLRASKNTDISLHIKLFGLDEILCAGIVNRLFLYGAFNGFPKSAESIRDLIKRNIIDVSTIRFYSVKHADSIVQHITVLAKKETVIDSDVIFTSESYYGGNDYRIAEVVFKQSLSFEKDIPSFEKIFVFREIYQNYSVKHMVSTFFSKPDVLTSLLDTINIKHLELNKHYTIDNLYDWEESDKKEGCYLARRRILEDIEYTHLGIKFVDLRDTLPELTNNDAFLYTEYLPKHYLDDVFIKNHKRYDDIIKQSHIYAMRAKGYEYLFLKKKKK